jgi:hypothetical protein
MLGDKMRELELAVKEFAMRTFCWPTGPGRVNSWGPCVVAEEGSRNFD